MEPIAYSRRFLRIKPDTPMYGGIRIVHVGGRHVFSNLARVRLLDISCGGAKFASVLKLPVDSRVILELSIEFRNAKYLLEGYVVNSFNTEVHEFEYGFCFLNPELELRQLLIKIFNDISTSYDRYIILRMSQGLSN